MMVSMNFSHFLKICQVLTILHQLISTGVANFGTRCSYGSTCDHDGPNNVCVGKGLQFLRSREIRRFDGMHLFPGTLLGKRITL